jgi:hypothetical protein
VMNMDDHPQDESSESGGAKFVDFADTEPVDIPHVRPVRKVPHLILWLILLPLGFTFFLTCFFLAMRGVMDLGGMVATGGPYEIAHPAPGYVWIIPVSIIGFMILVFVSFIPALSEGGGNLVAAFFWPAVFLSLAWNFIEYGVFTNDHLVWGWIVCGILFVLMGGLPVYFATRSTKWRQLVRKVKGDIRTLAPQFLGIALGISCGLLFFGVIS